MLNTSLNFNQLGKRLLDLGREKGSYLQIIQALQDHPLMREK